MIPGFLLLLSNELKIETMIAKTLLTALFLPIVLMFSDGDKGIAFEIFQKIPKLDLQECFRGKQYTCPDDCTRHFESDYESDADDIFSYAFEVNCLPANDGGWVAVLVNESADAAVALKCLTLV